MGTRAAEVARAAAGLAVDWVAVAREAATAAVATGVATGVVATAAALEAASVAARVVDSEAVDWAAGALCTG